MLQGLKWPGGRGSVWGGGGVKGEDGEDERNYKLIFDDRFKTRKKTNRFGFVFRGARAGQSTRCAHRGGKSPNMKKKEGDGLADMKVAE